MSIKTYHLNGNRTSAIQQCRQTLPTKLLAEIITTPTSVRQEIPLPYISPGTESKGFNQWDSVVGDFNIILRLGYQNYFFS